MSPTPLTPEKLAGRGWLGRHLILSAVCLMTLALLGLIATVTFIALRQPYSGLEWSPTSGRVYAVAPHSPAAAAGLQPGDLILAIDGQPWLQAMDTYTARSAGEVVAFTVRRDGKPQWVRVHLASPPLTERLRRLIPLLVALCFTLFGFLVWAHRPYHPLLLLFLAVNQLGASVLAFGTMSSLKFPWGTRWFGTALYLLAPVLVHFHLLFPRPALSAARKWLLAGLYGFALAAAAWWWAYSSAPDSPWYLLARHGARLSFAAAILAVTALLVHAYLTAPSPADRRRVRLVVFSTALAFTPLVTLGILPEFLIGVPLLPYEFTFPALLLVPLAYFLAIRQHDLLPIDRLVHRGVVHLSLLFILTLLYLVPLFGLPRLGFRSWAGHPLPWALTTLLIAFLFAPLRHRLQALADRLFYGGWYDYRSVIGEMTRALAGVTEVDELADLLVGRLGRILRLREAALFLATDDGNLTPVRATGREPGHAAATALPLNGALAQSLRRAGHPISTADLCLALAGKPLVEAERKALSWPELAL